MDNTWDEYIGPDAIEIYNKLEECLIKYTHSNAGMHILSTNEKQTYTSAPGLQLNTEYIKQYTFRYQRAVEGGVMFPQLLEITFYPFPHPRVQIYNCFEGKINFPLHDDFFRNNIEIFLPIWIEATDCSNQRSNFASFTLFQNWYNGQSRLYKTTQATTALNDTKIKMIQERALAFAMGSHPRLGQNSAVAVLPKEMNQYITKFLYQ